MERLLLALLLFALFGYLITRLGRTIEPRQGGG